MDFGTVAEPAALFFGQLGGGDAQNRILAGSGHMQINLAAHHLRNIYGC